MVGILIVVGWLLVAVMLCLIGNTIDSKLLLGVGAVMIVMTTAVYAVNW